MRKIFISQPMKGRTDEFIKAERKYITDLLTKKYGEIEVLDTFFENAPYEAKPLWFLAKSLQYLSTADVAVFAKHWEEYRGCRIENTCAKEYGIEVIEL